MRLLKRLYTLMIFLTRRAFQVVQVRLEHCLYRSKFIRAMAGYE
jgi:hypothetical protein